MRKNGGHKQIQCGPNKQCTYVGGFVVCLNNGGRMQNSHLAARSLVHGIVHCVNCVYRIEYISGAPTIIQKTLERRMFLTLLWKSLSSILAVCFSGSSCLLPFFGKRTHCRARSNCCGLRQWTKVFGYTRAITPDYNDVYYFFFSFSFFFFFFVYLLCRQNQPVGREFCQERA